MRPSPNGANGGPERDSRGRFRVGNRGGPGNPHARQVAALRAELLTTVTPRDLAGVVRAMLDAAKGGDVAAAGLILRWTMGEPAALDVLERLNELETLVRETDPCESQRG